MINMFAAMTGSKNQKINETNAPKWWKELERARPLQKDDKKIEKLLEILADTYQIAGVYDAPSHVLDVLANPKDATQEQIDALLPFVIAQPAQPATPPQGKT